MSALGDEEESEGGLDGDLYLRLNLSREATTSEISNAYRRLSRIFHPDKHADEALRTQALAIFHKIQEAHDILMDDNKRAIYDMYGMRGLQMKGWEIVERTPTAAEIREEYERLKRRKEEEKLFARTHPVSKFTFGLDMTDLFDRYLQEPSIYRYDGPRISVWKMQLFQSVMGHLTVQDSLRLSGSLGKAGKRTGMFQAVWRHLFDKGMYTEVEAGLSGKLYPHMSASLYRPIGERVIVTLGAAAAIIPSDQAFLSAFMPGLNGSVVVRLAKQVQGRLASKWNIGSMTETELVWTTAKNHRIVIGSGLGSESYFLKAQYTHNLDEHGASVFAALKLIVEGVVVEYGGSKRLTAYTNIGATVKVGAPLGVMVTLRMTRGSQAYVVPLALSDYVDPVALFYGSVVPFGLFYSLKRLVYDPWEEDARRRAAAERRRATASERASRRAEAMAAQRLMRESVRRGRAAEASRGGLLLLRALYGRAEEIRRGETSDLDTTSADAVVVEVTAPLQALVVNSSLVLPGQEGRWRMTGFYDPCPDEPKLLRVQYSFRGAPHEAVFDDSEPVRIPLQRHRARDPASDS